MVVINSSKLIAITVAVKREAKALFKNLSIKDRDKIDSQRFYICAFGHRTIIIAILGIGIQKAIHGTNSLIREYCPSAIISIGFAGAVNPHLKRGTVILGEKVFYEINREQFFISSPKLLALAKIGLRKAFIPYSVGKIFTVTKPLYGVKEKMNFGKQHQCLAVELETAAVAETANRKGIPFLPIRFVLDEVQDDLSFFFNSTDENRKLSLTMMGKISLFSPKIIDTYLTLRNCWATSYKSIQTALIPVLREILKDF